MVLGFVLACGCTSATRTCRPASRPSTRSLYRFLLNKWYFDELYDLIFVRPALWLGRFLWKQRRRRASSTASGPTASRPASST